MFSLPQGERRLDLIWAALGCTYFHVMFWFLPTFDPPQPGRRGADDINAGPYIFVLCPPWIFCARLVCSSWRMGADNRNNTTLILLICAVDSVRFDITSLLGGLILLACLVRVRLTLWYLISHAWWGSSKDDEEIWELIAFDFLCFVLQQQKNNSCSSSRK